MPSKNVVKNYIENGYYHIYNRGVEKRNIFLDEQDCKLFLYYLKLYLSSVEEIERLCIEGFKLIRFIPLNLSKEVDLLAFSLMPNHFHLFVKQYSLHGINKLVQRVCTSYVMYFNRKYGRTGALFQGTYKACLVTKEPHFLHLSKYIHLNPSNLNNVLYKQFTSYPYYLKKKQANWVKPNEILDFFNKSELSQTEYSYKDFVEDYLVDSKEVLGDLALEEK